jgi:hypothetical protein
MRDFHSISNGLGGGPSDPGRISFEIVWAGHGRKSVQTDGKTFSFDSVISTATVAWSSVNNATGMRFVSDPASTSHSRYAAVGHEKNGRFFG